MHSRHKGCTSCCIRSPNLAHSPFPGLFLRGGGGRRPPKRYKLGMIKPLNAVGENAVRAFSPAATAYPWKMHTLVRPGAFGVLDT